MLESQSSKPDLLIVDDRADNLHFLSQLLRDRYRVRVTISGEMALQAAWAKPPDLILLDILMPQMDGYEVCKRLKQDPRTRDVPVLFLSALAQGEDKVRGFQVGGADYITKPFQTEEVITRIEHQLTIRTLQLKLARKNRDLAARNRQLEAQIQQRRQAERDLQAQNLQLDRTLSQLRALQSEVILREKMTALGRLAAGITGEINDPLTVIRTALYPMREVLGNLWLEFPQFWDRLSAPQRESFIQLFDRAVTTKATSTTKERRHLQRQLARKLKSLEIPDPDSTLSSILVELGVGLDVEFVEPLLAAQERDRIFQEARTLVTACRSIDRIEVAVNRADRVLRALNNYAGRDISETPVLANVTEGLEMVRSLFRYRLPAKIQLVEKYSSLPLVSCYPNELSQVWTNLMENALQAMGDRGILTIETAASQSQVRVSISDNRSPTAPAIEINTHPHTQLDWYICQKIIQKHRGSLWVNSTPDGTRFTVSLPIAPNE